MATLINITRGDKKAGKERYVMLKFGTSRGGQYGNILQGAFGANALYQMTIDLQRAFPQAVNDDGEWSANVAYKQFKEIMHVGDTIGEIHCYDVAISDISDYVAVQLPDGRVMRTFHLAAESEEIAVRLAKSNLLGRVKKGSLKPFLTEEEVPANMDLGKARAEEETDDEE